MSAVDRRGMRVSLLDDPEQDDAFWRAVLVCDRCARVRDLRHVQKTEELWMDQAAFLAARGLSSCDVWWCHTICHACLSGPIE